MIQESVGLHIATLDMQKSVQIGAEITIGA